MYEGYVCVCVTHHNFAYFHAFVVHAVPQRPEDFSHRLLKILSRGPSHLECHTQFNK
jgi:hypothetical protein